MGNCYAAPVNNHSSSTRATSRNNSKQNGLAGIKKAAGNSSGKTSSGITPKNASKAIGKGNSNNNIEESAAPDAAAPSESVETKVPKSKEFSLAELKKCTRRFRPDIIVGVGGSGRVFKGWVNKDTYALSRFGIGMAVAVKKSNPDSYRGLQEWQAKGEEPLRWELRLKIAIGAARGLAFLHTSEKVIYHDFKTSDILLDSAQ
ncbi:PREDICTED: protein kinase APK1A, chloroplastic-like [Prunus mume]|uniref:Protein kinase APK1A, chloroplastic-like n=1 Tax=Prunus mume TaxID=102107 RepID=A0ABM1LUD5_PRUMU|nr:PREDICTED: protein kinase APK1A, chloroplastic-like [Prunus mume]